MLKYYLYGVFLYLCSCAVFAAPQSPERLLAEKLALSQERWLAYFDETTDAKQLLTRANIGDNSAVMQALAGANQSVLNTLGTYSLKSHSWYQLRAVNQPHKSQQSNVLITYAEQDGGQFEAFDQNGNIIWLDEIQKPDLPVIVLELNDNFFEVSPILLQQKMKREQAPPLHSKDYRFLSGDFTEEDAQSVAVTVLNALKIKDFDESWLFRKTRVFAIVTGLDIKGKEPYSEIVDFPYLSKKDTVYQPNQYFIFWQAEKFDTANVAFFQHRSLRDFRKLVLIVDAVLQQVPSWPPELETTMKVIQMGMLLVQALPDSLFEKKENLLDIFYGLEAHKNYEGLQGTLENVELSISPKTVPLSMH